MKVLIAIDELSCAQEVVKFVTRHNWGEGTEFSLVHAVSPMTIDIPMTSYPLFLESTIQAAQEDGRQILKTAALGFKVMNKVDVHTNVIVGHPIQVGVESRSCHFGLT